jgi:hypothetical protein
MQNIYEHTSLPYRIHYHYAYSSILKDKGKVGSYEKLNKNKNSSP